MPSRPDASMLESEGEALYTSLLLAALEEGKRGDVYGIIDLLRERLQQRPHLGFEGERDVALLLIRLAAALHEGRRLRDVTTALHEAERMLRKVGDFQNLAACLDFTARTLQQQGDPEGALAILRESEQIYRRTSSPEGLQRALGNQASILIEQDDVPHAILLLAEQNRICRETGDERGLMRSLGLQAKVMYSYGDTPKALDLYGQQERLCREVGEERELVEILGYQGLLLVMEKDFDRALARIEESERICHRTGDTLGLARAAGVRGLVFEAQGELAGALELQTRSESLCREAQDVDGLCRALTLQAQILAQLGRDQEASSRIAEAADLARRHGLTAIAEQMIQPVLQLVNREDGGPPFPAPGAEDRSAGEKSIPFWKRLFARKAGRHER